MLRTLLTPLVARFDLSPRTPSFPQAVRQDSYSDGMAEDFARDVIIEIMRTSVENLKYAEHGRAQAEVLTEIQRIMAQDDCTKEVFREMDGFLILMSVLSTIHVTDSQVVEPEAEVLRNTLESVRLVFLIASDAMHDHPENAKHFIESVGYDSLAQAITVLVAQKETADEIAGLLLALAMHDFSVAQIFKIIKRTDEADMDATLDEFTSRLGLVAQIGAIKVLWDILPDPKSYGALKLFYNIAQSCHRNQALFSTLPLVRSLFERYCAASISSPKERHILQRFMKRLLDMGARTKDARQIFQRAIRADETLNTDVLDIIKAGIKSRWPDHFSLEDGAALVCVDEAMKGMPTTGFTFMMWVWIEKMPDEARIIFSASLPPHPLVTLTLGSDGKLHLETSSLKDVLLSKAVVGVSKWTHITLVHHPNRTSNPSIRVFVDGTLCESFNSTYPRSQSYPQGGLYVLGDPNPKPAAPMSWCIASAQLLSMPLGDDLPRFIHHLGPRYAGNLQDPTIVRFLTYEASTSLNMFLATATAGKNGIAVESSPLMKVVREGMGITENSFIFSALPANHPASELTSIHSFESRGDVAVVKAECLDAALWKIGGAAVALRFVKLARTPHELSRALGILMDGLKSWQTSEDMERFRGYEILADILRSKSEIINLTAFEIMFEFLGLNFRTPEQSTIVNMVAYRALALDFELFSKTRKEVQRAHLEHFATLLVTSRYKRFNAKQRFVKLGLVRKVLFVLQTEWYQEDMVPLLIDTLQTALQANFSKEDAIKPVVSYLAANLQPNDSGAVSPVSYLSRNDPRDPTELAEQILKVLTSMLSHLTYYNKFTGTLPMTRICLLLLGDRPSHAVAQQVLLMVDISISTSATFSRKFELVSGWNVLKTMLPSAWNPAVNEVAFDILLGRSTCRKLGRPVGTAVVCPHIVPTIFSALQKGLEGVANHAQVSDLIDADSELDWGTEIMVEAMIEDFMELHGSSTTFRHIFRSQQTTQLFIGAYKNFVSRVAVAAEINQRTIRILEKLSHFGLALALDNCVAGSQKREILDILQVAETTVDPNAEKTVIDPDLVVDTRSVRQRIASARFSVQLGERNVLKTVIRMQEWRKVVQKTEKKRLRKNILDLRENRRQVSRLHDWSVQLTSERGLWPRSETIRLWRLDETEGPQRIRKKLEPQVDQAGSSRVDVANTRDIHVPENDAQSVMQTEVPPWAEAEAYEISATDTEDRQLTEDIADDKHRRVRHELEPGDVIEAVTTAARVAGVDSSPGLLIFGRTHIYFLDGLVESDDGEIIDAHDAPKSLFFVPGSIVELDGPQRAQRWTHDQIAAYSDKTFLFRDVALEIYFKDSRSLLIVFLEKKKRPEMSQRLSSILGKNSLDVSTPGILRTPMLRNRSGGKVLFGFRPDELSTAQRKWQAREISNYTYLSIINQISGRTPSDATQYPVFPWVLQDYTSQELDLNSPASYRDLSKPMGALTAVRRESAQTRYLNLESIGETPFQYGTHFSSSMIVCHFLIRLAPFTNMYKTLQGGDWDVDRLFSDIPRAFESAQEVRGDVRELIPEFYNCPEFLENSARLDFGVQRNTGERIDHVKLPPWAKQDPLLFIVLQRKALESDYVSEHLPAWIDLIWGCKQRDIAAHNVFHPLSYEGSIDLDSITDELEREATVGIIHNFGQTPRKLFTTPHPERFMHGLSTLPLGTLHGIEEDAQLLIQGSRCIRDLGSDVPVRDLTLDMIGERIISCAEGVLVCPSHPHEQVEWGPSRTGSDELRVLIDHKVAQVIEAAYCTCAAFADSSNLVTGSSDHTVRLWKISRGGVVAGNSSGPPYLTLSHIMRVHTERVLCVTASRSWSLIVSGSSDGSAALWDLNRGLYTRSIWHGVPDEGGEPYAVNLVAINESTGYIATCSRSKLCLHTINARPMAVLDLTTMSNFSNLFPPITAMAFHEREYSHMGILATGGPDGAITLRTWTTDGTPQGEKAVWEFLTVRTMKVRAGRGSPRPPGVTALKFLGESLCHGDQTGKSFMWNLPD